MLKIRSTYEKLVLIDTPKCGLFKSSLWQTPHAKIQMKALKNTKAMKLFIET